MRIWVWGDYAKYYRSPTTGARSSSVLRPVCGADAIEALAPFGFADCTSTTVETTIEQTAGIVWMKPCNPVRGLAVQSIAPFPLHRL